MEDGFMRYEAKGGLAEAYLSTPKGGRILGQVIVIHEVWGFTEFISDTCERLSRSGFRAVAPALYWRNKDLFSAEKIREGMKVVWGLSIEERYQPGKLEAALKKGRASSEAASMLRVLYDRRFRGLLGQDLRLLADTLRKQHPTLRTAAVGFSLGGKLALELAGSRPDLAGCVAYSAKAVPGPTVRKISSPMLLLYGSEDRFTTRDLPAFVRDAADKGKDLTLRIYPSAGHEFFDHTNKAGFQAAAAEDAWAASVGFLRKSLSPEEGPSRAPEGKKRRGGRAQVRAPSP